MTQILSALTDDAALAPDDSAGFGALETERGRLPLVALEVRTKIADLHAETLVRQTFRNALDVALEATYIFPLPDRAAVTRFQLRVADRVIDGDLKERGQAREDYDRAIKAGHRAAIAEEERSGVFALRVGNLPPHENATVELTLVGPLPVAGGEATYRFPLVVAPRYTPGVPLDGPSVGTGTASDTDEVPDASRVTPPVLLPGFTNPVRLALSVELPKSLAPADLRSSLHSVVVEESEALVVRLQPGERLDRDFILRYPVAKKWIASSLSACAADQQPGAFALTILPPAQLAAPPQPREVVFVLDRSGSMQGWKMVAARRALGRMIDSLLDQDRFTVIAFDDHLETKSGLIDATNRQRWQMIEWLGKIDARGGTELAPAVEEALRVLPKKSAAEQILVLVTDGQVSGEAAVMKRVTKAAKGTMPRIFTVGIDRAVNAGFLQKLADLGRGQCELVESEERLDAAMERIHRLIATPVLTDVVVEPLDADVISAEQAPLRVPDLFLDRPVSIYGRHLSASGKLRFRVSGASALGVAWSEEITAQPAPRSLLMSIWGRARVRDLEDQYDSGTVPDRKALQEQIVVVSLQAHVLSRFTAYVAVDRSEVVNAGGEQLTVTQPVEMPSGWEMNRGAALYCSLGANMPRQAMRKARSRSLPEQLFGAIFGAEEDVKDTSAIVPPGAQGIVTGASLYERRDGDDDDEILQEFTDTAIDFTELDEEPVDLKLGAESAPVVKLVQLMLTEAITVGASAIHLLPQVDRFQIVFLGQGQVVTRDEPPLRMLAPIVARIRNLAKMAAGDQQGHFQLTADREMRVDVRIESTPYGESVVLSLVSVAEAARTT